MLRSGLAESIWGAALVGLTRVSGSGPCVGYKPYNLSEVLSAVSCSGIAGCAGRFRFAFYFTVGGIVLLFTLGLVTPSAGLV